MNSITRPAKCDGCNRIIEDNAEVTALIPVTVETRNKRNTMRLKLSLEALDKKSIKVYCKNCLSLEYYLTKDNK